MHQFVFDFETYYDNEYSLRKMTPAEYILDPRFEFIGCAVAANGTTGFLDEHQFRTFLSRLPDKGVMVLSHNALFDMCVLAWRFGYVPNLMVDTLGMSRAWLAPFLKSLSLASVARHLGLGAKGDTVHNVKGMSAAAIRAAGLWEAYADYSCNDAELCLRIYNRLLQQGFPKQELILQDMVLRCAVLPRFELNATKLAEHLHATQQGKVDLLSRAGITSRDELMSNDKFAAALMRLGVEPPRKVSPTTGKETWAFARTDVDFMALEEHEDADVQALVAARLGIKSTLEESRTERFIRISQLEWPDGSRGKLPIPLRNSGAHTHRLSGEWSLNLQNLPRGGALRGSMEAPEGHVVLAADSAQIEARMNAQFCGQTGLVQEFAEGRDVYSSFASRVFGYEVNKKDHPAERFIGKTGILGLGYGLGWVKFQRTVKLQSKAQTGHEVVLSDEEAQRTVNIYRATYPAIAGMWRRLNAAIPAMTQPGCNIRIGPIIVEHERIRLPSGLFLYYPELTCINNEWWFTYAGKPKRLYGGKLLENIIQALARIVVMDAAVRVRYRAPEPLAMQCHDELIYLPRAERAEALKAIVCEEMTRAPYWAPGLPLAVEADYGRTYGDAK